MATSGREAHAVVAPGGLRPTDGSTVQKYVYIT